MATKPNFARADKPNFNSILDEAPTEVVRPPPLPEGTYYITVVKAPEYGITKNGDRSIKFKGQIYAVDDDVDLGELEEIGGFEGKTIELRFYEIASVIWKLDQFHKDCGLELDPGISRLMRNDMCLNRQVGVYMKHKPSMDGESMVAEVARTLPAEA